jgi:hypothetical protein
MKKYDLKNVALFEKSAHSGNFLWFLQEIDGFQANFTQVLDTLVP